MNKEQLIKQELQRRTQMPDILSYSFDKQRQFIEDKAPFKAALCNRRAGKSVSIGLYIIKTALENPGSKILYIGLTRESAINILSTDIFEPICQHFNITVKSTLSKNQIKFTNNSTLFFIGMDASEKQMAKVLGQKYILVFLDEAQSYNQDIKKLIYQSLGATVQDMRGQIIMTGTPTDNIDTFFYEVTKQSGKREPGWSVYSWLSTDNTVKQPDGLSQAEKFQLQVDEFKRTIPLVEEADWFQQQYLCKWVTTSRAKVYSFNDDRNLLTDTSPLLTLFQDKNWRFILGIDFGFNDATTFCILAYHFNKLEVFVLHSEAHTEWNLTQTANRIKELDQIYHFSYMVGDSAAKQSIAEISQVHGLPIKPAKKLGKKRESVAFINADFITGQIKIDPSNCQGLIKELKSIIWDPKKLQENPPVYEELASKLNNEADAFNYAFTASKHYRASPQIKPLDIVNSREDRLKLMDQQDQVHKSIYDQDSVFHKIEEKDLMDKLQHINSGAYKR